MINIKFAERILSAIAIVPVRGMQVLFNTNPSREEQSRMLRTFSKLNIFIKSIYNNLKTKVFYRQLLTLISNK